MSTESKLMEIEILTPEQIESFDKESKENIVFLTENTSTKDLAKLNPLVSEILEIKEIVSNLKMEPIGEDGKYNKENIQSFVDAKQKIRKYRASVKSSAKELKENPARKSKAIREIEKSFIELADKEYNDAEKVFEEYVIYETNKKAEAQKRKDEAFQKQIDDAKAVAEEVNRKALKTEVFNTIKYQKITDGITGEVTKLLTTANEKTLTDKKLELESTNFKNLTSGLRIDLLDESVLSTLRSDFANALFSAQDLIDDKLVAIQNQKKIDAQEYANSQEAVKAINEIIPAEVPNATIGKAMPLPPQKTTTEEPDYIKKCKAYHNSIVEILMENGTEQSQNLLTQFNSIKW